jgi:hypothetical protein
MDLGLEAMQLLVGIHRDSTIPMTHDSVHIQYTVAFSYAGR